MVTNQKKEDERDGKEEKFICIYIHCGSSLRSSQTRCVRKPDVYPVFEAIFRKPVLAG